MQNKTFDPRELKRKHFFDALACDWDKRNYPPQVRARLAPLVQAFGLTPGMRVLDVGCGQGILVPYVREQIGELGTIYELDPSEAMLEAAAQKDGGRVHALLACAENIPLLSESLDAVIAFACFPHFEDPKRAVREFARVLHSGGTVVVAHLLNRAQLRAHHARHSAVEADVLPEHAVMRALFEENGFCDVSIEEADHLYLLRAKRV